MKAKVIAAAAAGLFPLGVVAQIWAPRVGLTAMLLAVMLAIAFVTLRQQNLLRRLAKHEHLIVQAQKTAANGKYETATYGASILRRVKILTDESSRVDPQNMNREEPNASPGVERAATPEVGRAATPDVSNPFTEETIHSMLTPGRRLKVGGVFSSQLLPEAYQLPWMPGGIAASLEAERPELLVIDEQELHDSAIWSTALTGVGTSLMREILEAIRWAKPLGIPTYLLSSPTVPNVHSAMLRQSPVVKLPLEGEVLEAAAGAPQTPVLRRLQETATKRAGEIV